MLVAHPTARLRAPSARLEDFRVGGWLVRSSLGIATRDGRVVHLRPQLVDLLLYLPRQDGMVATRPEIFAEVWTGQFVAPTCLARCVAELRQALGDDAKSPRLIETVLKRGYRLCQPVEWPRQPRPSDRSPAACPALPSVPASGPAAAIAADPAVSTMLPVVTPPPRVTMPEPDGRAQPPADTRRLRPEWWLNRTARAAHRLLSADALLALDRAVRRLSWRFAVRS